MKPASTTSAGACASMACGQRGIEGLAAGEVLVRDHRGGDAVRRARAPGPPASGLVADDGGDARTEALRPSARCSAARTMAAMLEPPPEIRITMFFMGGGIIRARFRRPLVAARTPPHSARPC